MPTLCAVPLAHAQPASPPAADNRPNIIVFVSDDHRADVLGVAGHPIVQTPHLDRLAERGSRFTNAFVTTSICAASRASILTGLTERTHGYTFGTPPLNESFALKSYPAQLKASGYRTGFVGKLGINIENSQSIIDQMFDSFVPLSRSPYLKPQPDGTTRHVTDITGDKAIEFIASSAKGTPFCLSVSFNAGHAEDSDLENHFPYPQTEAKLYDGVEMPRPKLDDAAVFESLPDYLKESLNRQRYHWRWDTAKKYDHNMRNYFRMLTGLDRNIGRVLEQLKTQGLTDNTVVIFIGDNGYYMGERGLAGKWSHFDESLRVPLIITDFRDAPSAADHRRVVETLALNIDIAATVLGAAGLETGSETQGVSLLAIENNEESDIARDGFLCEHLMRYDGLPRWVGYRTDRFKYARYLDQTNQNEFLHDLVNDPDELVNLATDKAHAKDLRAMRERVAETATAYSIANPHRPRVLMLGDSISMGYHQTVVDELATEAVVVRPGENCAGTTKGVTKIDEWLKINSGGTSGFDIIHFNFGLHDLKRIKPDGRNSNDAADSRQAEPEQYEQNLRAIVKKLERTGAVLIYATTTPFPDGVKPMRDPEDATRYNDIARRVMREHQIQVDDLHRFALPLLGELQQPANVHFSNEGSAALGKEVARSIREVIKDNDSEA